METVAIVQITPMLMMSSSRHPAWQTWTLWTTMKRKLETRQVSLDFCFVEISLTFSYIYIYFKKKQFWKTLFGKVLIIHFSFISHTSSVCTVL